jgi:hypothetical protein
MARGPEGMPIGKFFVCLCTLGGRCGRSVKEDDDGTRPRRGEHKHLNEGEKMKKENKKIVATVNDVLEKEKIK